MPLTLLLGGAGTGKTRACFAALAEALADPDDQTPLLLLVPEQATHQTERLAIELLGTSHRVSVLSFRRLAWRVFQEAGGAARPAITDIGRRMVLRAILQEHRDELRFFGALGDRPGILDRLARTLRECRAFEIGPSDLAAAADRVGSSDLLAAKLADLCVIMAELEDRVQGRYTDPDLTLTRLAERLPDASVARGARVWIDAFSGFTPQEYRVLEGILARAGAFTVTLCLDSRGHYSGEGVFYPTLETRERLLAMALRAGHAVVESRVADTAVRFRAAAGIAHLERSFFAPGPDVLAGPAPDVTLLRAPDPRAEVGAIAREIVRLCREEGFRFREIGVVLRDPDAYRSWIDPVFAEHGIPLFLDSRRSVAHQGLVDLLRGALEVVGHDWPYEPVFRVLKTDLVTDDRDAVDRLENLVLEFGIRGHARWTGADWPGPPGLAKLRDRIAGPLARYAGRVRGTPMVREHCRALFDLLVEAGVPRRLERWAAEAEQRGDLGAAGEFLQVYDAVLDLFDQTVEALGESRMSAAEFLPILEAGLSALQVGLVPPSLDQVLVGSVERSRHPELRAVFVAGAVEGAFPRAPEEDLVLDDSEREDLAALGLQVGPTSHDRLSCEPFVLYTALTRAAERLIVSYPAADAEGRALHPAAAWTRARALLPGCRLLDATSGAHDIAQVATGGQLGEWLALALRSHDRRAGALGRHMAEWLAEAPAAVAAAPLATLAGLAYRNEAPALSRDLAAALSGADGAVSASRLEAMAACPFSHFARYTLGLAPRRVYEVEPRQVGMFLHDVLERLLARALADRMDIGSLAPRERDGRLDLAVAEARAGRSGQALFATEQSRHLVEKLRRDLRSAAAALAEYARRGRFRPVGLEVSFGPDAQLPGLEVATSGDRRLVLRGRIDRVDVASREGATYVLAIDYKRRRRDLAIAQVESGISLQLALYLAVLSRHGAALLGDGAPDIRPGGMLYFPVQPGWALLDEPPDTEQAAYEALKAHKARGLLHRDAATLGLFGAEPGHSPVVPLEIKKDGAVADGHSRVVTDGELHDLLAGAVAAAGRLGEAILAGRIDVSPYRLANSTPCGQCEYRPVCRFDPAAGDRYRDPTTVPVPGSAAVPETAAEAEVARRVGP